MSLSLYDCLVSHTDSCYSATTEGAFEPVGNERPFGSIQTLSPQFLLEAIQLGNVLPLSACVEGGTIPGGNSPCLWWFWGSGGCYLRGVGLPPSHFLCHHFSEEFQHRPRSQLFRNPAPSSRSNTCPGELVTSGVSWFMCCTNFSPS